MRQIVLDTETTGLEPLDGHRIIEIGCVELAGRSISGSEFHTYINPERESDARALEVHQLTREFLSTKPKFAEIAHAFLDFVRGAELLIHNAPFDVGFLNAELARLFLPDIQSICTITDTYAMARDLYPGQRNGLDALCKRLEVDNSARTAHGALLDASLLAEVYLAMTRGQNTLQFAAGDDSVYSDQHADAPLRMSLLRHFANADELGAHLQRLAAIEKSSKGQCLWLKLDQSTAAH